MNNTNAHVETYGLAADAYTDMKADRSQFEGVWDECAALTLPYLTPNRQRGDVKLYSSVASSGVNALAAKLLVSLLPASGSFFRLLPDDVEVADYTDEELAELDGQLMEVEEATLRYISEKKLRTPTVEALKYLLITGNAALYKIPGGSLKTFSPYQFTVRRDLDGSVLDAVILEEKAVANLPETIVSQINEEQPDEIEDLKITSKDRIELYTRIRRLQGENFIVWQEVNGVIIKGSYKTYDEDSLPYMFPRWITVADEDYGEGLISTYLGDIRGLEGLSQAVYEAAAAAARTLYFVSPKNGLAPTDLQDAANNSVLSGRAEDVSVFRLDKGADLNIATSQIDAITNRLGKAFLTLSGNIRNSERTTASEVNMVAQELESTFGGSYSVLSADFQLPLLRLILKEVEPDALEISTPSISAGIAGISRDRDLNKMMNFVGVVSKLPQEGVLPQLNTSALIEQIATSFGIKKGTLTYSEEELAAKQAQAQAQQAEQMGAEAGLKSAMESPQPQNTNV